MSELKSWQDFCMEEKRKPEGTELTAIACPCCGKALYKDVRFVPAPLPSKYRYSCDYFCDACGWHEFA